MMKSVFAAVLAGMVCCSFVQPVAAAEAAKFQEQVLYSFAGGADGRVPAANLINVKGTLYGTTQYGGGTGCRGSGCGTVYAFDLSTGAEKVLYSFCSQQDCTDGRVPFGGLVNVRGTLYGTTNSGGSGCYNKNMCGLGSVFSINPGTGAETVVHSFCSQQNCTDGEGPAAGLIKVNGTLYGTTDGGGTSGVGTVFSIDPKTGAETVLYSFGSNGTSDGYIPISGLIDVNGTLYGTTKYGGGTGCQGSGCGTVYAFDLSTGVETVLYSFCSQQKCTDGYFPISGLIDVNGTLYGTVRGGDAGLGLVYSVDPGTGTETMVYSFHGEDGKNPQASLINVRGALYGTTEMGGSAGRGTVFSFDPGTGKEKVLCSFTSQTDGEFPLASLIDVKGTLYGTTADGGGTGCGGTGCGTVFALKKQR